MLPREEYIEQAHFFMALQQRLSENRPMQEVLASVHEEILATTKLPMAIDFMLSELKHQGAFGSALEKLDHYFTPFQSFVIREAENERGRFDLRVALSVLQHEAQYRADGPSRPGIFLYQFESLCRNRLGYDQGLTAIAGDPTFDEDWSQWILTIRRQVGMVDLADLIYVRSEYYGQVQQRQGKRSGEGGAAAGDPPVLFGEREGRIALANRHKDPLLLFSALHRQLGYPQVPRPQPVADREHRLDTLGRRIERIEARLKLLEEEQRGGIDLSQFFQPPETP